MAVGSIVQVNGEGNFMADTLKPGEIADGGIIIQKPLNFALFP
jgi:hypothetical protein